MDDITEADVTALLRAAARAWHDRAPESELSNIREGDYSTAQNRFLHLAETAYFAVLPPSSPELPQIPKITRGEHVVYLAWGEECPLYVGVTSHFNSRMAHHRSGSAWWPRCVQIETFLYPSRELAERGEAERIRSMDPECNISMGTGRY